MELDEQVAIVTGGSRGIGKAIALKLAEAGAKVAIFAMNPERGQAVVEEIGSERAKFYQVNVSDKEEVAAGVKSVIADFGAVHVLVNNAGITRDNLLMRISEDDWDSVLDTNLKSCYNTCQAVYRPMLKAKKGKIINISSVIGLTGNAGQVNYAASKSGMIGLTQSLARELASRGICVNCVAPGFIETEMTAKLNEKQHELTLEQIPMRRMGKAEEIAEAVLFLAGPRSNYITGQVLTVDGGMVM